MNANLATKSYYVNGIEFLGIVARKNILSGEQLFYDYGTDFFANAEALRFKSDGRPATKHKKIIGNLFQHKTQHLRIMAACGVKNARNYLLIRISAIVIISYAILLLLIKY